jgi:agmatine/peptidylarginine deiminase
MTGLKQLLLGHHALNEYWLNRDTDEYIQELVNFMNADNFIYYYPPNGAAPYVYAIQKMLKFLRGKET